MKRKPAITWSDAMANGNRVRAFVLLLLPLLFVAATPGWTEEGEHNLARAEVSFTDGIIALDDGDGEKAAGLFLAAVAQHPGHGDALHWLGVTYLRLGRPADAAARLEESLKAEDPPTARRGRVRADLRKAREAARAGSASSVAVALPPYRPRVPGLGDLPRWQARLGLAALHDSNPGLLPEDLLVPLPGHPLLGDATADDAALLDASVALHPFQGRSWSLGLAVDGRTSKYRDQRDLDLSQARGVVSMAWGGDPAGSVSGPLGSARVPSRSGRFSFLLQGGGTRVWLGGDSFLSAAEGAFSVMARHSPGSAVRLDLEIRDSSYSRDGSGALHRGGTEAVLGLSHYFYLGRRDRWLRLGAAAGEQDSGQAFDSASTEAFAELAAPLSTRWTLSLLGSYREDRFDNPESSLLHAPGRPRDDATWRVTAASAWRMTDHLQWVIQGSHVQRESNVLVVSQAPLFDYERTTLSLGVDWSLR
jgi:hypothetical protein